MKLPVLLCVLFLGAATLVEGAVIRGTVYDLSLDRVSDVLIEVNSTPPQRILSSDGAYELELGPGSYALKAYRQDRSGRTWSAEEPLLVSADGTFLLDLILYPELESEDDLSEQDPSQLESAFGNGSPAWIPWLVAAVLLTSGGVFVVRRRKAPVPSLPAELTHVCTILRKEGGRMTQKELRQKLPYSEAKVSLLLADLESRGLVKRIRKGRANILVLEG